MRIDVYLVAHGYADSRAKAQRLIREGAVTANGRQITKTSEDIKEGIEIRVADSDTLRYVSRGGLKLEAALKAFGVTPEREVVADIGASTGGFTDCLLQHGAARVFCVDAGRDQLVPALRQDPRVCVAEQTNARYLTGAELARLEQESGGEILFSGQVDGAVMDVSFISQTLLFPMLAELIKPGGWLVSLIKPQFEVGRAGVQKHGIVKKEADRLAAVERVRESAAAAGFDCCGVMNSPILGGDGNHEYLGCFVRKE